MRLSDLVIRWGFQTAHAKSGAGGMRSNTKAGEHQERREHAQLSFFLNSFCLHVNYLIVPSEHIFKITCRLYSWKCTYFLTEMELNKCLWNGKDVCQSPAFFATILIPWKKQANSEAMGDIYLFFKTGRNLAFNSRNRKQRIPHMSLQHFFPSVYCSNAVW